MGLLRPDFGLPTSAAFSCSRRARSRAVDYSVSVRFDRCYMQRPTSSVPSSLGSCSSVFSSSSQSTEVLEGEVEPELEREDVVLAREVMLLLRALELREESSIEGWISTSERRTVIMESVGRDLDSIA